MAATASGKVGASPYRTAAGPTSGRAATSSRRRPSRPASGVAARAEQTAPTPWAVTRAEVPGAPRPNTL
ncbi:MAG TPA: hypothetical protein VFJ69_14615, partial [Actinomycetota bacterium]|nr:hypothetical protein [Actinomycetota bacterium]